MFDVAFFYSSINRGGSELALLRYLQKSTKISNSVLVYFKDTSDLKMIEQFEKVITVKKLVAGESISAKTAVNCMISTTENGFFDKIKANKYILWVQVNPQIYSNYKDFDKYDSFLTTSNYIKNIVTEHPSTKGKSIFLANPIVDFDEIREKAIEKQDIIQDETNNLITIARISHEKGYDYIVEVAKRLKLRNINFKWYLLGFISQKEQEYYQKLLTIINDNNLNDNLIFMGAHENPYKYLKHAHINILLSKNEAWGLAITEAKALAIPSIASNNSALKEQIQDGINGVLVNLPEIDSDYEIIVDKIEELLSKDDLYWNIITRLKTCENNIYEITNTMDNCFFN